MPKLNSDEKWRRFNKKIMELMKSGSFYELGTTYYQMADFVKKEGKDNAYLRDAGYKMKCRCIRSELKEYKKSEVVSEIEIHTAGDTSCIACRELNGKILSVDDALLTMPIPVKECSHKYGCRCCYLPIIE